MENKECSCKIKIQDRGPYIVTGNVPLREQIIIPIDGHYEMHEGRALPQSETYTLCRCGKSKNAPFCDGAHNKIAFVGKETASKESYHKRAKLHIGKGIDLMDDGRCAGARFCFSEHGKTWKMLDRSDESQYKELVIKTANECFAGRLTAVEKDGTIIEPDYEPSIDIIQDPEKGVSAAIFVKGYIPIEGADGSQYEVRNRIALCRCGKSHEKPFCDIGHISTKFQDGSEQY